MAAPAEVRSPGQGSHADLLRRYFLREWPSVAALIALVLAIAAITLTQPRILAAFIDAVTVQAGLHAAAAGARPTAQLHRGLSAWPLPWLAMAFLALAAAGQALAVAEAFVGEGLALTATNRVRSDLLLHCLRLDLAFHHAHSPGELVERVDGDVGRLANFFSRFLIQLFSNGLLLAGALIMITLVDWRIGVGLVVLTVAAAIALYRARGAASPLWDRSMQAQAEQSGLIEEAISATEDIRSSGAVRFILRRFFDQAAGLVRARLQATLVGEALVGSGTTFLFAIASSLALAAAVWLFRHGEVDIGRVFLIFTYAQMLSGPVAAINRQVQDFQTAQAAIGRVRRLLDERPGVRSGAGGLPPGALGVDIEGVTFRYGGKTDDTPSALADVSLRLPPGRVLGVVGRTGAGKSTLTRLLLRLADPQEGAVRIGGADVRDVSQAALRRRVGLVPQTVSVFHASVRDNVTLFDPEVPDADVEAALSAVGLGPWLARQADGVRTRLAAGSGGLSAGEAQLLAFARAFLQDPGLVILDEATSRLDPQTERLLQAAVDRLLAGRTAVVVAHRLTTVMRADDILVLEAGRAAEFGPRGVLAAAQDSRFAQLLQIGLEEPA